MCSNSKIMFGVTSAHRNDRPMAVGESAVEALGTLHVDHAE